MPLPEPPPEPPRIEWRAKAPAPRSNREVQVLIASNQIGKQHEIVINLRHYKFMIPKGWKVFDDSYKPTQDTGPLPGKINVQFVSPEKQGASITFFYRGRSIGKEQGVLFQQILQKQGDPGKAENVPPAQIKKMSTILGDFVDFNQYRVAPDSGIVTPFKMTSCKVISINKNIAALCVEGELTNHPEERSKPDSYWQQIYLDGSNDGLDIHQIALTAATKEGFEKNKPAFDQFLKSLSW